MFAFTHDFGSCFTYDAEETLKVERLQVMFALQNSILLQYFGDLDSHCFHTRKDMVIPPVIFNEDKLKWSQTPSNWDNNLPERKLIGAYFRSVCLVMMKREKQNNNN